MKTQTIHTNEMTLQPLFGQLANKTHNLTGIASTSTDATTHDHKEVKMKSQTNNKTNSRKPIACSFAIAAVLLSLAGASANAQTGSSGKAQSPIGPTTCTLPIGGGNLCPSSSYRIGAVGTVYNSNLTGSPLGDGHVLNSTTVANLQLNATIPAPGGGSCSSGSNPTSSPSVASRVIFPALDASGNCSLGTYAVVGHSAGWRTTIGAGSSRVVSSAGYAGADIYIGSGDGNLYAYGYTSGTPDWVFNPGTGAAFNSSPTTWPNLDGIYIIDDGSYWGVGAIYKVDASTGMLDSKWPVGGVLSNLTPGGTVASASSLAVSTCGGSCNLLFAAGTLAGGGTGDVEAYYSDSGNFKWANTTSLKNPATSSPVVSDRHGLVYVQTTVFCGPVFQQGYQFSGGLIYALDQVTGTEDWKASPIDPQGPCPFTFGLAPSKDGSTSPAPAPIGANVFSSGGSPAYDDAKNYVIASAIVNYVTSNGNGQSDSKFQYSVLNVFDADRRALNGGNKVCQAYINNPVTGAASKVTNSSPEVVSGVIYIGTDDGYIQAYDESTCTNLWNSTEMDSALMGPPVVSFNRVHAVSQNGTLYVWALAGY